MLLIDEEKKRKLSFFSVLFTFFVDNLGWSIVFPIFAPFFIDEHNVLFSPEVPLSTRTTILGVFLMAFPLAQFLGAPILGEVADRYGRKKSFFISIFLTFIGYVLSAISMANTNLYLLFISRMISGLFSGNLSICLASMADLSLDKRTKMKNFSYLSAIAGFSFILGAFLGGKFSDHTLSRYFSYDLPLWIAALLAFVNMWFIWFGFSETFQPHKKKKFDFLESFHNIRDALKTEKLKQLYLIYFLFVFAWTIVFQFSPVVVIRKFQFTNSEIGDLAAFIGVAWAIGSGAVHKILLKRFSSFRVLEISLLCFTVLSVLVTFQKHLSPLFIILGICGIIGGTTWPICSALISNLASKEIQGKVLGMSQSMQSLAMAFSPLIGGFSDQFYVHLPFILAGVASFLGSLLYFQIKFK